MRAMIDGPYVGWKPTIEDWDRMKACSVFYVDKDGLLSSTEIGRGPHRKFQDSDEYNRDASPNTREETSPLGGLREITDLGAFRQAFSMDGPAGYGAIQPGDLPPADFFANNPSPYDSSVMSSSSGHSSLDETNRTTGTNRGSGGINGVRITGDPSSVLPMGLMIYNDLMMDIDGTARFLGQEFQDSVLFGASPTSSPPPAGYDPDRGSWLQPSSTMQGWVRVPSARLFHREL